MYSIYFQRHKYNLFEIFFPLTFLVLSYLAYVVVSSAFPHPRVVFLWLIVRRRTTRTRQSSPMSVCFAFSIFAERKQMEFFDLLTSRNMCMYSCIHSLAHLYLAPAALCRQRRSVKSSLLTVLCLSVCPSFCISKVRQKKEKWFLLRLSSLILSFFHSLPTLFSFPWRQTKRRDGKYRQTSSHLYERKKRVKKQNKTDNWV